MVIPAPTPTVNASPLHPWCSLLPGHSLQLCCHHGYQLPSPPSRPLLSLSPLQPILHAAASTDLAKHQTCSPDTLIKLANTCHCSQNKTQSLCTSPNKDHPQACCLPPSPTFFRLCTLRRRWTPCGSSRSPGYLLTQGFVLGIAPSPQSILPSSCC